MEPALITALTALAAAVSGTYFTYWKLVHERDHWNKELLNQRELWQKEHDAEVRSAFLHELVAQRFRTYPPVFKLLGGVTDVPVPELSQHEALERNRRQLLKVASELFEHLYGEAGLFMSMETRNAIFAICNSCHLFHTKEVTLTDIVGTFYQARRLLRADLQIQDPGTGSELGSIRESFAYVHQAEDAKQQAPNRRQTGARTLHRRR